MSWLKIDDSFATHPKLAALSDADFRVWVRVLCFCARYKDPTVDAAAQGEVRGLTPRRIHRFFELDLLDKAGESHVVHDWLDYLPKDATGAERQARWRANRNGTDPAATVTEPVTRAVTESEDIPF